MFCFCVVSFADTTATCKVKNSEDDATVVATIDSYDPENKTQSITISNDGKKAVNVTFVVSNEFGEKVERSALAYPWQSTVVNVKIAHQASKITIRGARCQ